MSDDATAADGADGAETRVERINRIDRFPTEGPRNSLWSWTDEKSPPQIVVNYLFVLVARLAPSLRVKNWALRRLGVTVAPGVAWGLEATPDVFWPERIELREDCIIGYDAVLLCHEFLQDEYRVGDVVVGERAMVGAKTVVLPGVEIGPDAQVAAGSLVTEDVPAGTTVAGVPAEPRRRSTGDDDPGERE